MQRSSMMINQSGARPSHADDDNDESHQQHQTEPPEKRLRFAEPDLKIILKFTDEHDQHTSKVYHLYSTLLASLSTFIEASLSGQETATSEIALQDVKPGLFEKALKFQQDASAIRLMTALDAVDVVQFYHDYGFEGGLKLCDQILSEYLRLHKAVDMRTPPDNLNLLVDASALAFRLKLPTAKDDAIAYLNSRMGEEASACGPTMFSQSHLRKLQPMFIEGVFDVFLPTDMTREEVSSPLFPRYFATMASDDFSKHLCYTANVVVAGTDTAVDGIYQYSRSSYCFERVVPRSNWNGTPNKKFLLANLKLNDSAGWVVLAEDPSGKQSVLWKCPYSGNIEVPPPGPWVAVDAMAQKTGNPFIHLQAVGEH